MSTTPMTEAEAKEFIAKGGEFGDLVSKLTQRVIDAETKCSSQEVTMDLQAHQIETLEKRLANSEAERNEALHNLGLVDDAQNKITAILRETRGQRNEQRGNVEPLSGRPMRDHPDPVKLRAVSASALEGALFREQTG